MSSMFLGSDANIFLSLPVHRCFWSLWWWSWNRGWRAEAMDKQKRWGSFRVMQWTGCSTLFTVWWVKEDGLVFVVSQNMSMFRPVGLWVSRRWGIILFNIVSMLSMNLQLHEKNAFIQNLVFVILSILSPLLVNVVSCLSETNFILFLWLLKMPLIVYKPKMIYTLLEKSVIG